MKYFALTLCFMASSTGFANSSSKQPLPILPIIQTIVSDVKSALCKSNGGLINLITSQLKICPSNNPPTPQNCGTTPSGGTVSRTKWKAALVSDLAKCQSETQVATCNNGTLSSYSGTFQFDSCQKGTLIPNLAGLKMDAIQKQLDQAGLRLGTKAYEEASTIYGLGTRQSPAAGQLVESNTAVNVWLSKGISTNQDADGNGLRDDIDAYIDHEYPVSSERMAMLQLAHSSSNLLKVTSTSEETKALLLANVESYYCVKSIFGSASIKHKANLDKVIFNSRDRFLSLAAKLEDAAGLILESRDESTYKDSCK